MPDLRPWQAEFFKAWSANDESFALQADTGTGKTRVALLAAALTLSRGGRAFLIVQTHDHLQQLAHEARQVLQREDGNSVEHIMTVLSGKVSPVKRVQRYADPALRLFIISAETCARDLGLNTKPKNEGSAEVLSPSLRLRAGDLLVLDEGDLMRGEESLARISRWWKGQEVRPRLLVQSATLTITHNPPPDHWEVEELRKKLEVRQFFSVPSASSLNYQVAVPSIGRLSERVCEAARSLRDQFWTVLEGIAERELTLGEDLDSLMQRHLARMRKERVPETSPHDPEARHRHLLPSVKRVMRVIRLFEQQEEASRGTPLALGYSTCLRDAYQALALFHCHHVLTNEPRVSFLEYAGRRIVWVRESNPQGRPAPPHLERLFPPGALPYWWRLMAEGTPYEVLPRTRGEGFFCSDRELGSAASALARLRFVDHPAMHSLLGWLGGGIRTQAPGQAMIVCGSAVEAMYVRELARVRRFETSVALMGHAHLSSSDRVAGFRQAHAGEASIVTATSVAERGVDLQSLRYLLVLNPPYDLRQAKQLLGRCGRNPEVQGTVAFAFAEGSSRELTARVLASKAARYGADSPLRGVLQERFPRKRKKRPPPGPGLFD